MKSRVEIEELLSSKIEARDVAAKNGWQLLVKIHNEGIEYLEWVLDES